MKSTSLLFFLVLCLSAKIIAQDNTHAIHGKIVDSKDEPIPNVSITIDGTPKGTFSDKKGDFSMEVLQANMTKSLVLRHIQYVEKRVPITDFSLYGKELVIVMKDSARLLDQVDITDQKVDEIHEPSSTYRLNPLSSKFNAAPFQDISALLVTLPGVSSNNEFSSGYSVRGGNFDENLVYVNNIPIYRPQIITSGQQEGLGFVNTDLVSGIEFSSGGWEAKYGDGLASVLNINYKKPTEFSGSVQAGLLGGSAHVEGISEDNKFTYLVGARLKSSTYLLNTLETKGEYRPRFADIQGYLNYDISKKEERGKTEIGLLFSYAQNQYLVEPTNRETTFGTFDQQLRLYVAFDGQEKLTYNTWQGGLNLSHRVSDRWNTHLILSGTNSMEREYYDIESGYLLCNVDNNPSSSTFNKCLTNIGIGTNYYSGRNRLDATLLNVESRNEIVINGQNTMEFGLGYSNHNFDDLLQEYEFIDSADYVTVTDVVQAKSEINYSRVHAYWQNTTDISSDQTLTYGFRMLYQDINNELLFSPRVQYSWKPVQLKDTYFRASVGLYQQAPFYREFRNSEGEINKDIKAQSSLHAIVAMDKNFMKWGRLFKFITEVYYKNMWDVNPYDIENVRIRYYADNIAKAYATGIDFRISGEFIPGNESWFSLGFLSTKEDLETDDRGYIPRPTDQRVNVGIFFQDHIPNTPTFRVHLRLLYSTGLPFSPPDNPEYRNSFRGSEYQRADIGFSKMIDFGKSIENPWIKSLWLSAEILNLTANENTISYYWVKDVNSNNYAVPNSLSQRLFNIRMNLSF